MNFYDTKAGKCFFDVQPPKRSWRQVFRQNRGNCAGNIVCFSTDTIQKRPAGCSSMDLNWR